MRDESNDPDEGFGEEEHLESSVFAETIAEHKAVPLRQALSFDARNDALILECGHEFPVPELQNKETGIEIQIGALMQNLRVQCWDCYVAGMRDAESMVDNAEGDEWQFFPTNKETD